MKAASAATPPPLLLALNPPSSNMPSTTAGLPASPFPEKYNALVSTCLYSSCVYVYVCVCLWGALSKHQATLVMTLAK
jgi:hypothetical protein